MILRAAKISDIDNIMQIERTSFAHEVCETRETFAKRIRVCKNCFLVFEDDEKSPSLLSLSSQSMTTKMCFRREPARVGHASGSGARSVAFPISVTRSEPRLRTFSDRTDANSARPQISPSNTMTQTLRVVGYFSAEKWRDIPKSDSAFLLGHDAEKAHVRDGRVLYLSSFALLPAWRGKGIGKTLFSRALEWFCANNDIDTLLLLVSEAWKGAVHIYKKAGFQLLRSIPDFFTDDGGTKHAGLVMKKRLTTN